MGAGYKAKSKHSELEAIPSNINGHLTSPTNDFMRNLMGEPRRDKNYSKEDNGLDNKELERLHKTDSVGPFAVTGCSLAIESLKIVMADIKTNHPDIYSTLGTAGMRSVRLQRSKKPTKKISNHAWGTAIDLKIDGLLDPYRDGKTQHGLTLIAPIFNKHGWYWGGAFRAEDAMHFEVSKERLLEWHNAGLLGPVSTRRPEAKIPETTRPASTSSSHHRAITDWLQRGDRGPKVVRLQEALKSREYNLNSDGVFGRQTEFALKDFQRKHGLPANGIVGPKTAAYLLIFQ